MRITVFISICFLATVSFADTVMTHDGRVYEGEVLTAPNAPVLRIRLQLGTIELRASEVREVRLGKSDPAPNATGAGSSDAKVDQVIQAKFVETQRLADLAASGGEGLAIWQQFLREHPDGSYAELARQKMAPWRDRAAGDLVRFGPQWLPRADVQARQARSAELVRKAAAATMPDEAVRLLDQAAAELPYQADIPLKKAMILYKLGNMKDYGLALGDVLRIDPDNVVARNNVGVLYARQKQWGLAIANIGKAATLADDERLLDNLDQLSVMVPASFRAECERMIQQAVAQLRQSGKYQGKSRWGELWVSDADLRRYQQENADIDRRISTNRARLDAMKSQYAKLQSRQDEYERIRRIAEYGNFRFGRHGFDFDRDDAAADRANDELRKIRQSQRQIEDEATKIRDEMTKAEAKRHVPPHTGKLIVLAADSSELESIQVGPVAPEDNSSDKRTDDRNNDAAGPRRPVRFFD